MRVLVAEGLSPADLPTLMESAAAAVAAAKARRGGSSSSSRGNAASGCREAVAEKVRLQRRRGLDLCASGAA